MSSTTHHGVAAQATSLRARGPASTRLHSELLGDKALTPLCEDSTRIAAFGVSDGTNFAPHNFTPGSTGERNE